MIYLNNSVITNGYKTTYSVKLNDLSNISKATINQDNYFLYKTDYEKYKSNLDKNFTIVGGNSAKELATNTTVLITNSLKSSNFDYKLSDIYQKDNNYYVDVEITIKKQIKNSYNNNGTKINFIPLYFSISYADLNNCVTDTYANSSKYSSYYVIK
jgi:hypothetical protein